MRRSVVRHPLTVRGMGLAAVVLVVNLPCAGAEDTAPEPADDGILVERDDAAGTIEILVPARDGRVDWNDVFRGLARAARLDDAAIDERIDAAPLDLKDGNVRLILAGVSLAAPDVHLRVVEHPRTGQDALSVRLEADDARDRIRRLQARLRKLAGPEQSPYGLVLSDGWHSQPPDRPVCVLIHGYESRPESLAALDQALTAAGWPTAQFSYPNDGPAAEAAELLSRELAAFRDEHPERRIAIVAHSFGGLVARATLENPDLDPGNVDRLVMVCPPNHGSCWAELPGGLDAWEHLVEADDGLISDRIRRAIFDGLDEARADMRPGSRFLRQLNARNRNPRVRYSIILGTGAPFTAEQVAAARDRVLWLFEVDSQFTRRQVAILRPRIEAAFGDVDEAVEGQGDGLVSVARGRLDGVDDVVLLPIRHVTVTRLRGDPTGEALLKAIVDRLD